MDPVGPMDGYLVEGEDEPRDLVGIGSDMVDYGDTYPGSTRPSQGLPAMHLQIASLSGYIIRRVYFYILPITSILALYQDLKLVASLQGFLKIISSRFA